MKIATRRRPERMKDLQPPDSHLLNAASGWLGLGLPREAAAELEQLSPSARAHPDVLTVEWELLARGGRWPEALEIASRLLAADLNRPTGWINRSYALHELRRTDEAHESLLAAYSRFPEVGVIPYNLACYACQMGRLDEARKWLREAMVRDGREIVIGRARDDHDLLPLRDELERI